MKEKKYIWLPEKRLVTSSRPLLFFMMSIERPGSQLVFWEFLTIFQNIYLQEFSVYSSMRIFSYMIHYQLNNFFIRLRLLLVESLVIIFYVIFLMCFWKNFLLYGPFLWMGFNCLKATATSRRQFNSILDIELVSGYVSD